MTLTPKDVGKVVIGCFGGRFPIESVNEDGLWFYTTFKSGARSVGGFCKFRPGQDTLEEPKGKRKKKEKPYKLKPVDSDQLTLL